MKNFHFIWLLIWLVACSDSHRVYEKNFNFEGNIWAATQSPSFEFQIADASKSYKFYYNIRNSINYPFHNLYLSYTLEDSSANELSTSLQNIDLFDPKTGTPYGDGLGDIFDHQVEAVPSFKFDRPGLYRFKIEQYMRQDSLPLILSVGVRVEEIVETVDN